ncbi:MAG: GNAT family N-acetyltransferase [Rhodospirillaceae bacterium]
MTADGISADLLFGVGRVEAAEWDACAGSGDPFVSHAFFAALEESGAASGRAGWLPLHLAVRDRCGPDSPRGRLAAVVPLYLKSHSYGEYVFDQEWAVAYERGGLQYYPKLQIAVPFTPVTGRRLLLRPDADPAVLPALVGTLEQVARHQKVSSIHATFCTESEWQALGATGWLQRLGVQYHWINRGYRDFDDFLDQLTARKRKAIRKEREAVATSGVRLHTLVGDEIRSEHWDAFHRHYVDTSDRKWGLAYLNREFFQRLGAAMPERVMLVMAEADGRWIGGALNLIGDDTLYGRNWGGPQEIPFLHFEVCYYRAIEFAISRGINKIEAGAQGEHKRQRGYDPVFTYSAHWVRKCGVREVLVEHLERERVAMGELKARLETETPYRQS